MELVNNNKTVKQKTNCKIKLVPIQELETDVTNISVSCGCMTYQNNTVTDVISINIKVPSYPKHIPGNEYKSSKSVTITFEDGSKETYKINYHVTRN
mgnify:CR=1 FL=1